MVLLLNIANFDFLEKFENYTAGCIQTLAAKDKEFRLADWARLNCEAAEHGHFEIVKIVSPLMDNPNNCSWTTFYDVIFTPIFKASENGHLDIVKFLVPLSEKLSAQALEITVKDAWYYPHVVKYLRSIMKDN